MKFIVILAAIGTLAHLSRRLPLQNLIAIAFLICGLSFIAELLGAHTGIPFRTSLSLIFHVKTVSNVAWPVAPLWIVILLLSRHLARGILRRRRTRRFYGTEILLLSSAMTAGFYALTLISAKQSLGILDFVGLFFTALMILLAVVPWLIEKKPAAEP